MALRVKLEAETPVDLTMDFTLLPVSAAGTSSRNTHAVKYLPQSFFKDPSFKQSARLGGWDGENRIAGVVLSLASIFSSLLGTSRSDITLRRRFAAFEIL